MAVVTPLIVFRHEFVRLYAGEQYYKAANVLLFWLLPVPFQLVNVMLPQIARAKAKVRNLALRTLCVQVTSLVAIFVVVWQFRGGCLEAAMTFAFFNIIGELVLIWPHGCKLVDIGIGEVQREIITPGFIPMTLGFIVLMPIRNVYQPDTWLRITAASAVGGIAYLCGILVALTADDRKSLLGLVGFVKKGVVGV